LPKGTRHHAVGVITRKSNAQVRSSSADVAEHVVVGMAFQPERHFGVDLAPIRIALGVPRIVRPAQARGGRGTSPPRSAARERADQPTTAHAAKSCPSAARRSQQRLDDPLFAYGMTLEVLEELQPRGQKPQAGLGSRALTCLVMLRLFRKATAKAESLGSVESPNR